MPEDGFQRREKQGIAYYTCRALDQVPGLSHAFSTRHGGVSPLPDKALNLSRVSWDSPQNVEENRRRFFSALALRPETLATLCQTHSSEFHIINGAPHQWNPGTPGDALITRSPGLALAVQLADCFPILAADPVTRAIACVHAGWRGTLGGILPNTLSGMVQHFGCDPLRLLVAIGPGIRSCCMEVGEELAPAFKQAFPGLGILRPHPANPGKYLLDLPQALKLQAAAAGIPEKSVFDLGMCTRCRPDEFFSYRAEGAHAGRMMAVITWVLGAG